MLNLSVVLEHSAREYPDRTAVIHGDVRLPYSTVNTLANQVANLLVARGIGRGDKVALLCPNLPYFPIVYYGILKAGATVVPLNVLLQAREIAYHLEDSDARALFCFEGTPDLPLGERGRAGFDATPGAEHFIVLPASMSATESPYGQTLTAALHGMSGEFDTALTSAEDTAVILYTSGTTGRPKGAELTHQNMVINAMVADEDHLRLEENIYLATLPLFHSYGQTTMMNAGFRRQATLVMLPRFDPVEALRLMNEEKVTLMAGVPTMYWAMLNAVKAGQGTPPASLGSVVSGGASLPTEVLNEFSKTFGVEVLEGYGLSETSPVASTHVYGMRVKPGSIGKPIWGVEMKLIDNDWNEVDEFGEIAIRGHNVMKGYYKRPEATAEVIRDGWFRTGDLARRDEDGYYYIVDRAKDMIIRGGFNVYPREVEEVLMTHPDVSLAAVVGIPHQSHGEEVKAYIIRQPGATVTEDDLIAWSRENMAAYKYPRIIEFRETLPMTSTGKILKRELR